jgi:hypothetical protein
MFKRIALAALFLLVLAGGAFAQDATVTPDVTPEVTPEPILLPNGLTLGNNYSSETIENPKLDITVSRPVLTGGQGDVVDTFNQAVDQIVEDTAGSFKNDTLNAPSVEVTLPPEIAALGSFVDVRYNVTYADSHLISVFFTVFWYGAGAAHPNSYSVTLNYDLDHARALNLSDVFKPGSKYLETLASYATQELKQADRLTFPEGADPTPDNYRSWNILPNGLRINFDDYQVTPHAVGPQQVVVPYSELQSLIRPDGPLAAFA